MTVETLMLRNMLSSGRPASCSLQGLPRHRRAEEGEEDAQLVIVASHRRVSPLQALMKPMWAVYGAFELEELGNAPIGVAR